MTIPKRVTLFWNILCRARKGNPFVKEDFLFGKRVTLWNIPSCEKRVTLFGIHHSKDRTVISKNYIFIFMTRIGLISDTHGWLDEQVFKYFQDCNEIWHAGDFGNIEVSNSLAAGQPASPGQAAPGTRKVLRGAYGNIDGVEIIK